MPNKPNPQNDGVDRRGFLKCMTWAGTALVWTLEGGIAGSRALGAPDSGDGFTFVQISDSHIGFSRPANTDVTATLQQAIARINALPRTPEFIIHTGDLTHLSKPSEFDTLAEVLRSAKTDQIFFVPGEHDMLSDEGRQYLDRFGKGTKGAGWYSFDKHGVHFVGLVNVVDMNAGGLGNLGEAQLGWLAGDLSGLPDSTPIVAFAHIPLWSVYPEWGWGTADGARALALMKRFAAVTVLNGHIHQIMQKVEGNVSFHTARSTAFPQPQPGSAPSPGPMKVPAGELAGVLGITEVSFVRGRESLAIVDSTLAAGGHAPAASAAVNIDNFAFTPAKAEVAAGDTVTWTNHDDVPHAVVSTEKRFASPVLDTDQQFSYTFREPGVYPYYCRIHPMMTGRVAVSG
jgi:plastocyanin